MKIFVCIKQVPDTETKIKLLSDSSGIDQTGIKWVMNPYDEFAVEEGIKLKEKIPNSSVYVLTLGPKQRSSEVLRTALAMGADEGIIINCVQELDTYASAKLLSKAIQLEGGAELVLTGKMTIDDGESSLAPMLAEFLNFGHVSAISKLDLEGDQWRVERDVEGGAKEVVQIKNPCVLSANKGLNLPRYASLPGIMKAKKKVLKEYESEQLGLDASMVKVSSTKYQLPNEKSPVKILQGETSQKTKQLVELLRNEAKVI